MSQLSQCNKPYFGYLDPDPGFWPDFFACQDADSAIFYDLSFLSVRLSVRDSVIILILYVNEYIYRQWRI